MLDLPTIWAGLLALAIFIYVILDGFDLGIGLAFPFLKTDACRDQAMNSVAPVWDGNETWLVLGGGGLMAAFPLAYAVVMPALYAPFIAMILALVFRGVAFEYRWRLCGRLVGLAHALYAHVWRRADGGLCSIGLNMARNENGG